MTAVKFDSSLKKQLRKLPKHIYEKLLSWARAVRKKGIHEVRKSKGFHDEPLKGKRLGQRSVRLSLHYRAIYRETKDGICLMIIVEEVHKHDY